MISRVCGNPGIKCACRKSVLAACLDPSKIRKLVWRKIDGPVINNQKPLNGHFDKQGRHR